MSKPQVVHDVLAKWLAADKAQDAANTETGVLPNIFIGAQAPAKGHTPLTRNSTAYRSYCPGIALMCP